MAFRAVLRWRLSLALAVLLMLAASPALRADVALNVHVRSALIIGNASYGFSPLDNPINDARALAGSLRELGFEVTLIENASLAEFQAALASMPQSFQHKGVGLFYYAGHAVQHQGVNYLLPTDFDLDQGNDIAPHSISINTVLKLLEEAGVGLKLVVLDACRNYPFGEIDEAFGQGLASVDATGETLVAYATAAGQWALDGDGPNSPYTSALVSALELPGHDIYDVFRDRARQGARGDRRPAAAMGLGLDRDPAGVPRRGAAGGAAGGAGARRDHARGASTGTPSRRAPIRRTSTSIWSCTRRARMARRPRRGSSC